MRFFDRVRIPEVLIAQREQLNAYFAEQLNNLMRSRIRTKEDALRREFQAHGWREWIEVIEESPRPSPDYPMAKWEYPPGATGAGSWTQTEYGRWLVVRRRPRGLRDWLRHKVWAVRVWRACRRAETPRIPE